MKLNSYLAILVKDTKNTTLLEVIKQKSFRDEDLSLTDKRTISKHVADKKRVIYIANSIEFFGVERYTIPDYEIVKTGELKIVINNIVKAIEEGYVPCFDAKEYLKRKNNKKNGDKS